jgi:flagellar biosynthesis/type III secretory pathway M-ring protein FliF/YscJ
VNGLTVVLCLGVVALSLLIVYAQRRAREQAEDEAAAEQVRSAPEWPLDPKLRTARAVRETFDGLPYRGGRGWK